MSTISLARRRPHPKISLHADLKSLFALCLVGITATSAAVTTAVQPTWLFQWSDLASRLAAPAPPARRAPGAAFVHPGVRLGMDEEALRTRFPGAKTLQGRDGTRVVTFETDGGARHVVWFRPGTGAHRVKTMRHYLAGTERQLLSELDAAFGRPASGGCGAGGDGCAFTWRPLGGGRVDATLAPTEEDPTRIRLAVTLADSGPTSPVTPSTRH